MIGIRSIAGVAVVVTVFALSACATQDPEEQALIDAVSEYVTAFTSGDTTRAYEMLSPRCQEETPRDSFRIFVTGAAEQYGILEVQEISVDGIRGDRGTVTYDVGAPGLARSEQDWLRVGDTWRWDDC